MDVLFYRILEILRLIIRTSLLLLASSHDTFDVSSLASNVASLSNFELARLLVRLASFLVPVLSTLFETFGMASPALESGGRVSLVPWVLDSSVRILRWVVIVVVSVVGCAGVVVVCWCLIVVVVVLIVAGGVVLVV